MNHAEFILQYKNFAKRAVTLAKKARREGLLSLEDELDLENVMTRDNLFEYGLRFAIDGTDQVIINKILSNIVAQDSVEYSRLLKTIQKEAVLLIQDGINPQLIGAVLNSYTDLPLSEDKIEDETEEFPL